MEKQQDLKRNAALPRECQ